MASPTFMTVLRRTLRAWIFIPAVFFVLAIGLLLANNAYTQVKKRNRVVSGAISYYVSSYIGDALRSLNHFSKQMGPQDIDIKTTMAGFYGASPHFERLLWLSSDGIILAAAPSGAEGLGFPVKMNFDAENTIISRPIISPRSGRPVIYLGVGFFSGGMLVGEMDTLTLSQHLGGLLPPGNTIILADRFGNIVSHPDRDKVLQQENIGDLSLLENTDSSGTYTKLFTFDGKLYIGSVSTIAEEGWKILIISETYTVFTPILQTMLALLAVIATLFFMVRAQLNNSLKTGLIHPLEDFVDDIRSLAQGREIPEPPFKASYHELETVEEEFRKMSREVRRREEELSENAERYRALFYDNRLVQLLVDPSDGAILDANRAAVAYYSYPVSVYKAMTIFDINTTPEEVVRDLMTKAAEQGPACSVTTQHRLANGEKREVEVFISPMVHQGKTLLFTTVVDLGNKVWPGQTDGAKE